jgi:hypothetical protein
MYESVSSTVITIDLEQNNTDTLLCRCWRYLFSPGSSMLDYVPGSSDLYCSALHKVPQRSCRSYCKELKELKNSFFELVLI